MSKVDFEDEDFDKLNEAVEIIIEPDELVKVFESIKVFEEWADQSDCTNLREAIKAFEPYELYEHCQIMKNLIVQKQGCKIGKTRNERK